MPMIDLTLPAGALPHSALTTLVENLTTTALRWERVADNPATRSAAGWPQGSTRGCTPAN
jgi:hypothetical protein